MDKPYYKLTELLGDQGPSYNKLWRSLETLREAKVISTFTGAHGAICLTIDGKRIFDLFLTYLETCKGSQKEALYLLRLDLLEKQVEELHEENRSLHALIEVKAPWWERVMSWCRRIWPRWSLVRQPWVP